MPTTSEIASAFRVFDRDGSGSLSPAELKAILCRPAPGGTPMTADRVDRPVREFDANGDGVLSVGELAAAWNDLVVSGTGRRRRTTLAVRQLSEARSPPSPIHMYDLCPTGA